MDNIVDKKPVKKVSKKKIHEVVAEIENTATEPTSFEERAKIEAEVTMIKIGRDAAKRWIFVRSDRITEEQKQQRAELLKKISRGERV